MATMIDLGIPKQLESLRARLRMIGLELLRAEDFRAGLLATRDSDLRRYTNSLTQGWAMPGDARENVEAWNGIEAKLTKLQQERAQLMCMLKATDRIHFILRQSRSTNHRVISARKAKKAEADRKLRTEMRGSPNGRK